MTRYLPIAIDIKGKKVLFVGGGRVAQEKLRTVMLFKPKVTVLALSIAPEIQALSVKCVFKAYDPSLLRKQHLIYACTDDRQVNRRIGRDARREGILCNVADDPERCDFISPAVAVVGDLVIAINSQARNPSLSVKARQFVKEQLDEFMRNRD